jgi:hypothetical protein
VSGVEAVAGNATDAAFGSSRLLPRRARRELPGAGGVEDTIELKLGFRELDLIHRSLEAVRTLGLVERQDGLLTDTLQLIDVALWEAA